VPPLPFQPSVDRPEGVVSGLRPSMTRLANLRAHLADTGNGDPVQVVCGAPNARSGMKGVFSPPGTFIPGKNITLTVGTIRGVESRGMLVSEFELQISDDHEGIIDLPADAPVGMSYAQWVGLDDPMIEINLTPNRGDCTGVQMLASVAAMQGRIAMWHALGEAVQPLRLSHVAMTVFTEPEIAAVGVSQRAVEAGEAGAHVVKDAYEFDEAPGMWIATFADPDDNYFQLASPYPGS